MADAVDRLKHGTAANKRFRNRVSEKRLERSDVRMSARASSVDAARRRELQSVNRLLCVAGVMGA